jgi:hypothetical protein
LLLLIHQKYWIFLGHTEKVTVQSWNTIMWQRFSVVLAAVLVGGMGALSYVALSPQTAAAPTSPGVEAAEVDTDAVASSYVQSKKRSGSGRRQMRGS